MLKAIEGHSRSMLISRQYHKGLQRSCGGAPRKATTSCLTPMSGVQPMECIVMDKNRVEGAVKQVKGSVKEVAGKVTGSTSTELEGKAEKTAGKVQSAVGKARDDVRDAVKP